MTIVGLTGGIGSGKSVVARFFSLCGIPVYNCDLQARRLMNESPALRHDIIALLGSQSYQHNQLNRPFVSDRVFHSPQLLGQLNQLVHPAVRADFLSWANCQNNRLVVVESAILFTSGLSVVTHKNIVVTAGVETRILRAALRDNLQPDQVKARILNQLSDNELIRLSDFVVTNDDNTPIIPQLLAILSVL